jgi:phosphatidylserine/phosphatidylglycerophosphate/cardiolipin synthase-like enzyme
MNRIVFTYEKTHQEMCTIINSSKEYCFLVAFFFDWDYCKYIRKAIRKALARGVKIFIITSERCEYTIRYKHPNLQFRKSQLYKKGDNPGFDLCTTFINSNKAIPYIVNHTRFIYNGDALLLGGTNVSNRYNGNYSYRNGKSDDEYYYWYDGGYLTYDYPNQFDFFNNIYKLNTNIRNITLNDSLFTSNVKQHAFLCRHIRNAKKSISIECQYFHTHSQHMSNRIGIELAERINRAIKDKVPFKVTILTNSLNHDERYIHYISTSCSYHCLLWFRSLIDCDDATFSKYVTCEMPTIECKIIIHQKCWIFDDEIALYTTGNLSDRSFYDTGDFEMGIVITEGVSDLILSISEAKAEIPLMKYNFVHPKLNMGYFYLDNLELGYIIYNIKNDIVRTILPNTDLDKIIGMRF